MCNSTNTLVKPDLSIQDTIMVEVWHWKQMTLTALMDIMNVPLDDRVCEWEDCKKAIENINNIGHVCAYQMTEDTVLNAQSCLFCNCCNACREACHQGRFEEENS
jgi:hypothetical protein